MEFRVLGPFEVVDEGRALELGGRKQRALLALLVLDANRTVSRERLIDALWEDEPTPTAAKALQVYVSQLRKTLGRDRVVTRTGGYLLRVERGEVDLERFQALCGEGRLHDALGLWRGAPLAELSRLRFAQAEIARLEELHLACLEARIQADLGQGQDVVGELEALVRGHPLRERLRELLLVALYRGGRQADALAAYQEARGALVDGLGIEPGKALRELQRAILRQDPALELAPSEPTRGVFVGRGLELEQLVAGLGDAVSGRGCLFLVVGEPGIGKSRLAEELIRRARARRVEVLFGRCWEAGGAPAYWPWVQSLRGLAAEAPPELAALLRGEPADSESERARFRLFDATAEFLRSVSRERPLLLFLDDMHAADEPSLLLLQFLARELARSRLLVVVACRDVDPVAGRELSTMLAAVAREPVTTRLSLGGLSEQAVGDYLEAELGSRELTAALFERTEGNPLFLGETVRLLAFEGRVAIPPSLREVIARRLALLSEECIRVLVFAAVLGREFDHGALASMSALSIESLLEALDEAMTARVVTGLPGLTARSRFAHVLIRDALYEGLTPARRVRLHRAAVETLERLGGGDAELAHHAIAGNNPEKAVVCARRAGDRALALLAYEEAARLYEVALAAKPDERTRCELLLSLGHAQVRAGSNELAKQTYLRAAASARALRSPDSLARAALGYGGRFVWARAGSDRRLVPLLGEALEAGDDLELALRARLLARLAAASRDDFDAGPRDRLSREAVQLARTIDDPATLVYALTGRYAAIWSPATTHERLAIATEGVELARRIGDKEREVEGHGHRFHALLELGRLEEADAELQARAALTEEMGQPGQLVVHLWITSMRHLLVGDFEAAETDIHHAFKLAQRLALGDEARITFELQRYLLRREQRRLGEIEADLENCANAHPRRPVLRCALVNLATEAGRPDEAQRRLDALSIDALPFDNEWLFSVSLLAESCGQLRDRASGEALYRRLLPYAAHTVADGVEVSTGSVARYLGILATTLGRYDEAARHFQLALSMNERLGALPWLAHTQHDYEQMRAAAPA